MTAINDVTDLSREGDVAVITLNNPPVNALSMAMRDGLVAALSQADKDDAAKRFEMRKLVGGMSMGKRVLNCFAYTGGFSVYAAAGGALLVDSVDISASAMQMAEKNMDLNGVLPGAAHYFTADVFQYLREQPMDYDLVILDPPAFAKRQKDIVAACRGYKDINRVAMTKMPKNSLLLTSSCSYHVDEALFQTVVFQAAVEAGRIVKILSRHRMAADHPINICHRESDYLKSLLLHVD